MICYNIEIIFVMCIGIFNISIIIFLLFDGYCILFYMFKFIVFWVILWLFKVFVILKVYCMLVVGIWKNLYVFFIYLENVYKYDNLYMLFILYWFIEIKFIYSY